MLLIGILALACASKSNKVEKPTETPEVLKVPYMNISVKNYGEIKIKLFNQDAPKNVNSVVQLVNKGLYNGLTFHRIIKGFVIQGGDPNGDGTGGPGYELADEISLNLKHVKGTVAMANHGPNTNGSQFYICLADIPHLDGKYTIIGQVVQGMDIVEKLGAVKTGPGDRPTVNVTMEKVWITEE
jgi:cyclophilin family peptidyl-prolyl cis-trans isomerase